MIFFLKEYNLEWKYCFGYGYYVGIYFKEIMEVFNGGVGNW